MARPEDRRRPARLGGRVSRPAGSRPTGPRRPARFVGDGGTLYVSDWQFGLVAIAFPEFIDRAQGAAGAVQTVHADVLDPGLQKLLGKSDQFEVRASRPGSPRPSEAAKVTTYLRGSYETVSGDEETAALLVQFPFEAGTVIFTSFHNETQNSRTELDLLRYLVFTAVNARWTPTFSRT